MRCFAAVLMLMLCLGSEPLSAETFEEGLAAFRADDYGRARDIWMPLAEAGDVAAQYSLAKLYENGHVGVVKNVDLAVYWYKKAVRQDLPAAQNNLALMYAQGRGQPVDQVRAAELWRAAALQDYPWGQYNLGLAYFRGHGVVADRQEAVGWFRRAADGGLPEAQYIMGQLRREGLVLAQDHGQALSWYLRAGDLGHAGALKQAETLQAAGVAPKPLVGPEIVPLGLAAVLRTEPEPRIAETAPAVAQAEQSAPAVQTTAQPPRKPAQAQQDTNQPEPVTPKATGQDAQAQPTSEPVSPEPAAQLAVQPPTPARRPSITEMVAAVEAARDAAQAAEDALPRVQLDPAALRVWLASAGSRNEARAFWLRTRERHPEIFSDADAVFAPVVLGKETLYRILAGPMATEAAATQLCRSLRAAEPEAFCKLQPN